MPKATVTLPVLVTVDVPEEFSQGVTREDLVNMARAACPDSLTVPPHGPPNGTQVTVDGVAQEQNGEPVFADLHVEHDITADPEIDFEDEGFIRAESEND